MLGFNVLLRSSLLPVDLVVKSRETLPLQNIRLKGQSLKIYVLETPATCMLHFEVH